MFIRQKEVSYKQADISNIVEILADKDIEKAEVTVRDNKTGKIYGATTTCLTKGLNKIAVNFFIKNPNLWWSNGLGKANLYEFRTEVKTNEQNKDCLIKREDHSIFNLMEYLYFPKGLIISLVIIFCLV